MVPSPPIKRLVRGGREDPTAAAPAGDLPWLGRFMKMLLWLSNRRWGRLVGAEPVLVSGCALVVVVSA